MTDTTAIDGPMSLRDRACWPPCCAGSPAAPPTAAAAARRRPRPEADDARRSCADDTTSDRRPGVASPTRSAARSSSTKPAERVAVLEWQQIEDVLTLCVTPVAVADVEGYTDVGHRRDAARRCRRRRHPRRAEPRRAVRHQPRPGDHRGVHRRRRDHRAAGGVRRAGAGHQGRRRGRPDRRTCSTPSTLIAEATGREERAAGRGRRVRRAPGRRPGRRSPTPTSATPTFVYFDGWVQGGNVVDPAVRPGLADGRARRGARPDQRLDRRGRPGLRPRPDRHRGHDRRSATPRFFYTGTEDPDGDVIAELAKNEIWTALPGRRRGPRRTRSRAASGRSAVRGPRSRCSTRTSTC